MYMHYNEQFMVTRLEEKVLDVAKKDIWGAINRVDTDNSRNGLPIFCEPIGDWYRRPFW